MLISTEAQNLPASSASCHVSNPFGPSTHVNSPVSGSQVTRRGTKRPERTSRKSVR